MPKIEGPLSSFKTFMNIQQDKIDCEKAQEFYNKYKMEW